MGTESITGRLRKLLIAIALAGTFGASAWLVMASEYLTVGGDNARTGWLKDEKVITNANVGQIKLLWKAKLPSTPRQMHNLFSPLIANVSTSSGPMEIAVVAGVSDDLWGLDVKTGEILWSKELTQVGLTGLGPQGGTLCPGGQTAVPTLQKMPDGKYKVWALGGDGRIWQIDAATGVEMAPPDKFAPPAGKAYALNLDGDYVYTVQAQGCGGATYQVDAYNIKTRRTTAFYPGGGGLWGRRGVTVDPEGRAYQGTGDGPFDPANKQLGEVFIQMKPDANGILQLLGWYAPPNANYLYKHDLDLNVSTLALDYSGRKFLIGTSKECRLSLMDRDNMGGGDAAAHREAVATSGLACNDRQQFDAAGVWGSIAAYVNSKNEAWIYEPFWGPKSETFNPALTYKPVPLLGGVAAYTISQVSGKWQFVPKWLSEDIHAGEEALIANDIVFVYGSGEDTHQTALEQAWNEPPITGSRTQKSTHATIYALDAQTGKTLWSSGNQITSFNHFSGITVANGRIYLGTYDGTMWCFGIAK
jgi:outer membrane protein assembly factor BamB